MIRMIDMRQRQQLVIFLGQILAHMQLQRNMMHMIRMIDMRQRQQLVTFLGQIVSHMQLLRIIHIAHDTYDRHETETTVGHIFGANFETIRDTYGAHGVVVAEHMILDARDTSGP